MNKKFVKIISIILMSVMLVSISVSSFALQPGELTGTDPSGSEISTVANKIIGILQTVGIAVSVIILIVIGIKYMIGSAEEKAEYKKTMMPYIIGAALIFAASALAQVIYGFFNGMTAG